MLYLNYRLHCYHFGKVIHIADFCWIGLHCKMAADLTHFLLPSSRLPTDVTFLVSGKEVCAHKSLLAAAHPVFDDMFFGAEAGAQVNRVKVS